jgi:diaminohydroxyphosphoribosylaminopyrimidine deaminase/5-amino-6-(5-phosphoribosylamino)uracil reductase
MDKTFMAEAIEEAQKRRGWTSPNPCVGAVIVRGKKIISRGHHHSAGCDHAEIVALGKIGSKSRGSTLYTTLEPCAHSGRTGPCTDAIINAGIKRVVIACIDPNPRVRRKGIRLLKKAGIEVSCGVLESECRELNTAYNFAMVNERPWVLMKSATSLDGRIATRTGDSQWITSEQARARGREFRAEVDAICVGVATVIADDPKLSTRKAGCKNPLRVILDSTLRTPLNSALIKTAKQIPTVIATTRQSSKDLRKRFEKAGAEIIMVKKNRQGRVDLPQLLAALYQRDVQSILVEGGAELQGGFVDAGLVDRVAMFLAPIIIGGRDAPASVGATGARRLQDSLQLDPPRVEHLGPDILLLADVRR